MKQWLEDLIAKNKSQLIFWIRIKLLKWNDVLWKQIGIQPSVFLSKNSTTIWDVKITMLRKKI